MGSNEGRRGRTPIIIGGVLLCALTAFRLYVSQQPTYLPKEANGKNPILARNQMVNVGGVERPISDIQRRSDRLRSASAASRNQRREAHRFGLTQKLARDTNPAVAAAYEAIAEQKNPEKVSVLIPPQAFDLATYKRDSESYLAAVEPGRVWQTAQPSDGTPILTSLAPPVQTMAQGESVRLKVKGAAGFPVTFVSLDLGSFSNQLPSITVEADEAGLAEAVFTATPGASYRARVLAASPGASEQVSFRIAVKPSAK